MILNLSARKLFLLLIFSVSPLIAMEVYDTKNRNPNAQGSNDVFESPKRGKNRERGEQRGLGQKRKRGGRARVLVETAPFRFDNVPEISPGHTPEKSKVVLLDSPLKSTVSAQKRLDFEPRDTEYEPIHFSDTDFTKGKWLFFDPWCLKTCILIDCNREEWDPLIDKFIKKINGRDDKQSTDRELFLASIIQLINLYSDKLETLISFDVNDDEICCRHFACMALPVFGKILAHKDSKFQGTVQQVSGDQIEKNWLIEDDGHVWQVVTLIRDGVKSVWMVDCYSMAFVDITDEITLDITEEKSILEETDESTLGKLRLYFYPEGDYSKPLKNVSLKNSPHFDFAKATVDRINCRDIYKDPETHERAAMKVWKAHGDQVYLAKKQCIEFASNQ